MIQDATIQGSLMTRSQFKGGGLARRYTYWDIYDHEATGYDIASDNWLEEQSQMESQS